MRWKKRRKIMMSMKVKWDVEVEAELKLICRKKVFDMIIEVK